MYSLHKADSRSVKHLPPRMSCSLLLQDTLVQTHQFPHILPPSSLLPECWRSEAPPQSSCSSGRYHHTGQRNSCHGRERKWHSLVSCLAIMHLLTRNSLVNKVKFLGLVPKRGKLDFPKLAEKFWLSTPVSNIFWAKRCECCLVTLVTKAFTNQVVFLVGSGQEFYKLLVWDKEMDVIV